MSAWRLATYISVAFAHLQRQVPHTAGWGQGRTGCCPRWRARSGESFSCRLLATPFNDKGCMSRLIVHSAVHLQG